MKKLLIVLALVSAVSVFSASAGRKSYSERDIDAEYFPRSEFTLSYGAPTLLELITIKQRFSGDKTTFEVNSRNHLYFGAAQFGYNFCITPAFSVGVNAGISYARAELWYRDNENITEWTKACRSGMTTITAVVCAYYTWYQEDKLELSSGAHLGYAYQKEVVDQKAPQNEHNGGVHHKFAYHLTAIKVRYGNIVGGFAELGFGYRALVSLGMSVKF